MSLYLEFKVKCQKISESETNLLRDKSLACFCHVFDLSGLAYVFNVLGLNHTIYKGSLLVKKLPKELSLT